jgi:hypothetical protein
MKYFNKLDSAKKDFCNLILLNLLFLSNTLKRTQESSLLPKNLYL